MAALSPEPECYIQSILGALSFLPKSSRTETRAKEEGGEER